MIHSVAISEFISYNWNKEEYSLDSNFLKKENTYIAVFGQHNGRSFNVLKADKRINILYESPKAVNKTPGHGRDPRNTLVIFELK